MSTVIYVNEATTYATVKFKYDANVVALIKTLPSYDRSWNSATKTWTVDPSVVSSLIALLRHHGHQVIRTGGTKARSAPPPPPPRSSRENWADALMEAVGKDRIEPVHRALTRVLHPDAGGDHDLMSQLNAARDRRAVA